MQSYGFNCKMIESYLSQNGHLVFSIFKKKQENNGVGGINTKYHRLWNKNEISPFLNVENTRCPFSEFDLFYTFPFDIFPVAMSQCVDVPQLGCKLEKNLSFQVRYPTSYSRNRIYPNRLPNCR